jgi:hypothetical protein
MPDFMALDRRDQERHSSESDWSFPRQTETDSGHDMLETSFMLLQRDKPRVSTLTIYGLLASVYPSVSLFVRFAAELWPLECISKIVNDH